MHPELTTRERQLAAIRAAVLRREVIGARTYRRQLAEFGDGGWIDGSGIYGSGVPHDQPQTRSRAVTAMAEAIREASGLPWEHACLAAERYYDLAAER